MRQLNSSGDAFGWPRWAESEPRWANDNLNWMQQSCTEHHEKTKSRSTVPERIETTKLIKR